MGIFDKLFGSKKKIELIKPEPIKENPQYESYSDMVKRWATEAAQAKKEKEEKIRKAIEKAPGSEKYVLQTQQMESNAHIMTITEFTPVSKKRYVVFDLETTGVNHAEHDIVEIGAVRVEDGKIVEEYSQLVNPDHRIGADASSVNHITNDMLNGKPKIYEVLPSFLNFIGDDVLVAHNVRFDYKFLAQACMVNKFKVPEMLFDTMALARYYPEAENKKLTTLIKEAGIELETAHRALSDARMTAKFIIETYEKKKKGEKKPISKELNFSRCNEDVEIIDNTLAGLRFCITGGIPGYERPDIERIIKQHNGRMTESISSKTDYLVLGTYDLYEEGYISNKQKAALEIIAKGGKIQIINAEKFFDLVNGNKG
ncbi:MAG: 3'-5' exoribonuclease [Clostridiales bacterium]|nr:3'-5' exoribonuclease [Clostridiales bacterium]